MHIKVKPSDYQDMKDFHIKWRWTDATWNLLPQSDLAHIQPLSAEKAREICEYSLGLLGRWELNAELFPVVSQIDDKNNDNAEVIQGWLKQHEVDSATSIIVSWDYGTSVITSWGIFCNYWDDFCYPLADDVVVWPEDQNWALFYFHEEIISFGYKSR